MSLTEIPLNAYTSSLRRLYFEGKISDETARRTLALKARLLDLDGETARLWEEAIVQAFDDYRGLARELSNLGLSPAATRSELIETATLLGLAPGDADELEAMEARQVAPAASSTGPVRGTTPEPQTAATGPVTTPDPPAPEAPPPEGALQLLTAPDPAGPEDSPPSAEPDTDTTDDEPPGDDGCLVIGPGIRVMVPERVRNDRLRLELGELPHLARIQMERTWESYASVDAALADCITDFSTILSSVLEELDRIVLALDADIDRQQIVALVDTEILSNVEAILSQAGELVDEIDQEEALKDEYRRARRQSRARVVGGGWSLGGFLVAQMQAGALNLASGTAHMAFNTMAKGMSSLSASEKRRRVMHRAGEIVVTAMENTVTRLSSGVLQHLNDLRVPLASMQDLRFRREKAEGLLADSRADPAGQITASLAASIWDNEAGLTRAFSWLLSTPGWETRIEPFRNFVLRCGPPQMLVHSEREDGGVPALLAASVTSQLAPQVEASVGHQSIHLLSEVFEQWWEAAGHDLLRGHLRDTTLALLAETPPAAVLLDRLTDLALKCGPDARSDLAALPAPATGGWLTRTLQHLIASPADELPPPALPGVAATLGLSTEALTAGATAAFGAALDAALDSDDAPAMVILLARLDAIDQLLGLTVREAAVTARLPAFSAWLRDLMARLADHADPDILEAVGRIAATAFGPGRTATLTDLAGVLYGILLHERRAPHDPELIARVDEVWSIPSASIWGDIADHLLATDICSGEIATAADFSHATAWVHGRLRSVPERQRVYDLLQQHLLNTAVVDPPGMLLRGQEILEVDDPRLSPPGLPEALSALRTRMLAGITDYPGRLAPAVDADVAALVAHVRAKGRYVSSAGLLAVIDRGAPEKSYLVTVSGVFFGTGVYYPHATIRNVTAVSGWTQDYVKFQSGDQTVEINKLGSMPIANVVAQLMQNGGDPGTADIPAGLLAAGNPVVELLLDIWAKPTQCVVVMGAGRTLAATLIEDTLLSGLGEPPTDTAQPTTAAPAAPWGERSTHAPAAADRASGALHDLVIVLCERYRERDLAWGDDIKPRKLATARQNFPIPDTTVVWVLVDGTFLGSNSVGLAITPDGLYWNTDWTTKTRRKFLSWPDFLTAPINRSGDVIAFGDESFFSMTGSSYPAKKMLSLLSDLQSALLASQMTGKPLV